MEDTHQTMYLDPSSLPRTPEPPRLHEEAITVTAGILETVLNRLASQQAVIEELRHELQTLRHYPLAGATSKAPFEFEAPEALIFKGERKELLPFLAKCHFKFESQPSRFISERSRVLYAGTHLEGPAFTSFQALFRKWLAGLPSNLAPEEIKDWEAFQCSLTQIYGDVKNGNAGCQQE